MIDFLIDIGTAILDVIIEFIAWVIFDVLADAVFNLRIPASGYSRQRLTLKERLTQAKSKRRNRAIRRWIRKGKRSPFPNIGASCPNCSGSLAGLTSMSCKNCGKEFDVTSLLDVSADVYIPTSGRRRR